LLNISKHDLGLAVFLVGQETFAPELKNKNFSKGLLPKISLS